MFLGRGHGFGHGHTGEIGTSRTRYLTYGPDGKLSSVEKTK